MTRTLADVDRDIDAKAGELAKLKAEQKALLAKTIVRCEKHGVTHAPRKSGGCGMALEVGELIYIQRQHYISPHGCTGGDYYATDSTNAEFKCTKCGGVNRLFARPEVIALKPYFKETVYEKDG